MYDISKILGMDVENQKKLFVSELKKGNLDFYSVLNRISIETDNAETRYYAKKVMFLMKKRNNISDNFQKSKPLDAINLNISTIISALSSNDYRKKIGALKGILKYHLVEAVPHIIKSLNSENDPIIISYMVKVIGTIGDKSVIDIIGKFVNHKNSRVRANAVEALDLLSTMKSYPYIVTAVKDSDNRVKANAIKALKKMGRVNIFKLLKLMIYSKKIPYVDSACYVLGFFNGKEVLELLKVALKYRVLSIDLKVREVLEKLSEKGNKEASELLKKMNREFTVDEELLEFDRNVDFNEIPEFNFEEDDRRSGEEEFIRLFKNKDRDESIVLIGELTKKGGMETLNYFRKFLFECDDEKIIATLVKAIGRLGDEQDIPGLKKFLKHEDSRVRANTVEALRMINPELCRDKLIYLMNNDKSSRVVANSILALSDLKDVNIFNPLEKLISSDNIMEKKSAFFIIVEIGNEKYYELLEKLLVDSEEKLKDEIIEFLEMEKEKGSKVALSILKSRAYNTDDLLDIVEMPEESLSIDSLFEGIGEEKKKETRVIPEEEIKVQKKVPKKKVEKVANVKIDKIKNNVESISDTSGDEYNLEFEKMALPEILKTIINIGKSGNKNYLSILKDKCEECNNEVILATLLKNIGLLGSNEEIEFLESYLTNDDLRVRANVIEALALIDINSVWPKIFYTMSTAKNNRVIANSIIALSKVGNIDIVSPLKKLSESDEILDNRSAFYVIKNIDGDELLDCLIDIYKNGDDSLQYEIEKYVEILSNDGIDKANIILETLNDIKDDLLKSVDKFEEYSFEDSELSRLEVSDGLDDIEIDNTIVQEIIVESKKKNVISEEYFIIANELVRDSNEKVALFGVEVLKRIKSNKSLVILKDISEIEDSKLNVSAKSGYNKLADILSRADFIMDLNEKITLGFNEIDRFNKLLSIDKSISEYIEGIKSECDYRNNVNVIRSFSRKVLEFDDIKLKEIFLSSEELVNKSIIKKGSKLSTSDLLPLFIVPVLGDKSMDYLIELMNNFMIPGGVRDLAIFSFGLVLSEESFSFLSDLYYDNKFSSNFRTIARAIGYHAASGEERALKFLIDSLEQDSSMRKQDALYGLALSGDIRVLEYMSESYINDESYVRDSIESVIPTLVANLDHFHTKFDGEKLKINDVINSFIRQELEDRTPKISILDRPDKVFDYIYKRIS